MELLYCSHFTWSALNFDNRLAPSPAFAGLALETLVDDNMEQQRSYGAWRRPHFEVFLKHLILRSLVDLGAHLVESAVAG